MSTNNAPSGAEDAGLIGDGVAWGDEPWGDRPLGEDPGTSGPEEAMVGAAAGSVATGPMAQATAVSTATFNPISSNGAEAGDAGIDLLLDVALAVSVELGRTRMKIGDILALRAGSVIELDKLAGEPADILVNGTLIARGEVVVVDEKFGVRVMEVVSRSKRVLSLG